jgi:hypothetical protein
MATSFDLGGLLGSAFGGDEYGDLLTPAQQSAIQQRALLSAASALLQAGAPSTTRTSLGQALGAALTAGQTGAEKAQQSALTGMLTRQKLEEARREQESAESFRQFLTGGGAGGAEAGAVTPAQALALPGMAAGPTVARAEMIGQPMPQAMAATGQPTQSVLQNLSPEQRTLLSRLKPTQGIQELMRISSLASEFGPEKTVIRDGKPVVIRENKLGQQQVVPGAQPIEAFKFGKRETVVRGGKPVVIRSNEFGDERLIEGDVPPEALQFGKPEPEMRDGKLVMIRRNPFGEEKIVPNAAPYQAPPADIVATEYILGRQLAGTGRPGIAAVGQYREQIAPRTILDMTGGQKGFENEMKLGGAFRGEQIYKDFNDMKSAYGQVTTALNQGTPIGDVAGATKVMKLLDPGSVVRESELGIAMAASGRMDRLQNYFSMWMSGEKLTPTQREDFKKLSNELYNAAAQAYNAKRAEYENFGKAYNFKNLDTALGRPATISTGDRPAQPARQAPKEGQESSDSSGRPIVFRNGQWVYR